MKNKISQWAGYSASLFSVIFFIIGILIAIEESRASRSRFLYVAMGLCMLLAACSGVVCLVSVFFDYRKDRKNSNWDTAKK
jgi:cytochrome bd-type quinol oxidase subunit 2